MRSRLKLKRYDEATIDAVIESLKKLSEIDDVKFASLWVDDRMRVNPAGDILLRRELKAKGVSDAVIESVLSEKAKNYDEHSIALGLAAKKHKSLAGIDRRVAAKKMYDHLLRRGFGYDLVERVVSEVMGE